MAKDVENSNKKQNDDMLIDGCYSKKSNWGENGHVSEERGMTNNRNS